MSVQVPREDRERSSFATPDSACKVAMTFWAKGIRATNDTPMLAEIADALEAIEAEGGAR